MGLGLLSVGHRDPFLKKLCGAGACLSGPGARRRRPRRRGGGRRRCRPLSRPRSRTAARRRGRAALPAPSLTPHRSGRRSPQFPSGRRGDQAADRAPAHPVVPVDRALEAGLPGLILRLDAENLARGVRGCHARGAVPRAHLQHARPRHRGGADGPGKEALADAGCQIPYLQTATLPRLATGPL